MGALLSTTGNAAGQVAAATWTMALKLVTLALYLVTLVTAILLTMLAFDPAQSKGFYTASKVFGITSLAMIAIGVITILSSRAS